MPKLKLIHQITTDDSSSITENLINQTYPKRQKGLAVKAWLLSALMTLPLLTSCGGGSNTPPPVDDTRGGTRTAPNSRQPQAKKGLSTTQKVAILGGAAALFYLYNKNKNKKGEGAQGQYYLSKNGRVYYRDEQKRVHWVTPPSGGIKVPEQEAAQYRDFKGYNNRSDGRDLRGLGDDAVPAQ
ncbi:hypothetical protein Cri9333_1619 [Crinalium epipsammum PCC 9333]|uniref:Uncharacterized protein n=1 Tax=Crinalium epipsammum PCC 9333 TaxID=1173022 RepID=K9VY85_9CYAN|nr:hypothetical protein Cri9333_1619 [Crinalium epipsammum PCC 9333]